MKKFNFDEIVPRRNTASVKWDLFEEDTLPLWVADMDFKASPAILGIAGHPGRAAETARPRRVRL